MSRRAVLLLLRFGLVYGALVFACYLVPAYAWVEQAATWTVDATLGVFGAADEERSVRFEHKDGRYSYVYDVSIGGAGTTLTRGYHKHGFVLVLFFGLALGTPGLEPKRRAIATGVGALLTFGMCVGMLMSDLQVWEAAAFAGSDSPQSNGPFPAVIGVMRGVHQTAAGGMLPIIVWAFLVAGPVLEDMRATAEGAR